MNRIQNEIDHNNEVNIELIVLNINYINNNKNQDKNNLENKIN